MNVENEKRNFEHEYTLHRPYVYFPTVQKHPAACPCNTVPGHAWLSLGLVEVGDPLFRGVSGRRNENETEGRCGKEKREKSH
jgi:hypothetical protein